MYKFFEVAKGARGLPSVYVIQDVNTLRGSFVAHERLLIQILDGRTVLRKTPDHLCSLSLGGIEEFNGLADKAEVVTGEVLRMNLLLGMYDL